MIHVFAVITAHPGQREAVLALFKNNVPAVHAEDGCVSYEAVVDVPNFGKAQTLLGTDTFSVVERWQSAEALQAHIASPHMREYGRSVGPLIAKRIINIMYAA